MVHLRLNEKQSSPNPFINFITALPYSGADEDSAAKSLLCALAAQVKPVMRAHGLTINSLEEYEVALGNMLVIKVNVNLYQRRNWNAGETIELVLRKPNGEFWPVEYLLGVLCHELSHIKHMHHLPSFHAFRLQLTRETEELRSKMYFGDGMWSVGRRLGNSKLVLGVEAGLANIYPDHICGGATPQSRRTALREHQKKRSRKSVLPCQFSGPQTSKRARNGSRVTRRDAFGGPENKALGRRLDEDIGDEDEKKRGAGFRKRTNSRLARQMRAEAAEKRLNQSSTSASSLPTGSDGVMKKEFGTLSGASDDGDDYESVPEEDSGRRKMLERFEAMSGGYQEKFVVPCPKTLPTSEHKAKAERDPQTQSSILSYFAPAAGPSASFNVEIPVNEVQAYLICDEVLTRKKESIGSGESFLLGGVADDTQRTTSHRGR
ncbi:WLM domain-containing protein [Cantharellus anzutake]|uniref:WLM domain-containing protein n=1 Tax=Cantharellus anzutake TaxID=1750568 RepID=UPI001905EB0C|nr:WLM domain-containing protein [Cantharellus anzutake]KAF8313511.1 WLM domain-containing protein [Cantharellus anzutake]